MGENEGLTLALLMPLWGFTLLGAVLGPSGMYSVPWWGLAMHAVVPIPEGFEVCTWS